MVLEDFLLMARGMPPLAMRRAERETAQVKAGDKELRGSDNGSKICYQKRHEQSPENLHRRHP
jgi:hypothetical protein